LCTDIYKYFLVDTCQSSGYETDTDSPGHHSLVVSDLYRRRRVRTHFSSRDMARLEKWFSENPYPGIEDRERYSVEISVDEARIHVSKWIFNTVRIIFDSLI